MGTQYIRSYYIICARSDMTPFLQMPISKKERGCPPRASNCLDPALTGSLHDVKSEHLQVDRMTRGLKSKSRELLWCSVLIHPSHMQAVQPGSFLIPTMPHLSLPLLSCLRPVSDKCIKAKISKKTKTYPCYLMAPYEQPTCNTAIATCSETAQLAQEFPAVSAITSARACSHYLANGQWLLMSLKSDVMIVSVSDDDGRRRMSRVAIVTALDGVHTRASAYFLLFNIYFILSYLLYFILFYLFLYFFS